MERKKLKNTEGAGFRYRKTAAHPQLQTYDTHNINIRRLCLTSFPPLSSSAPDFHSGRKTGRVLLTHTQPTRHPHEHRHRRHGVSDPLGAYVVRFVSRHKRHVPAEGGFFSIFMTGKIRHAIAQDNIGLCKGFLSNLPLISTSGSRGERCPLQHPCEMSISTSNGDPFPSVVLTVFNETHHTCGVSFAPVRFFSTTSSSLTRKCRSKGRKF